MAEPQANGRAPARRTGRWAILLLVFAAGGCAGPSFVQNPESGIELRWPNHTATLDEARMEADARCAPQQQAALAAVSMDRDETLARFYCR